MEKTELEVQVNGEPVGRVTVSKTAGKREMELAALSLRATQQKIGEATIKSFAVIENGVINIVA